MKFFKTVELSVLAASKMLNHAHFGQPQQVMGLLQGFYKTVNTKSFQEIKQDGVFVVTDVIPLPVESS